MGFGPARAFRFLGFWASGGFGLGKIFFGRTVGQVYMYLQVPNLGIKPTTFFGFRATGGAKFVSDRAGGLCSIPITMEDTEVTNVV